jgi:molecular chaperone GrpE
MTDPAEDERLLEAFRKWLQEARDESAQLEASANGVPPLKGFGLDRLVEEFTALRHELKLQTRSSRGLEERVEGSFATLAEAAATFRSAASAGADATDKKFALSLAELDESLARGRDQLQKTTERLAGTSSAVIELNRLWQEQSWWKRTASQGYHQAVVQILQEADEQARRERQTHLGALLSGYDLIQQRLHRILSGIGITRIPTLGGTVDPEKMVVVEVVEGDGPEGQVVEEVRRGYAWKGVVLKPAEVRASRPRSVLV